MRKFRGLIIRRIDKTVQPDKNGKYPLEYFRAKVSNNIPPDHKICRER